MNHFFVVIFLIVSADLFASSEIEYLNNCLKNTEKIKFGKITIANVKKYKNYVNKFNECSKKYNEDQSIILELEEMEKLKMFDN